MKCLSSTQQGGQQQLREYCLCGNTCDVITATRPVIIKAGVRLKRFIHESIFMGSVEGRWCLFTTETFSSESSHNPSPFKYYKKTQVFPKIFTQPHISNYVENQILTQA